jgi:hypothetical protein
MESQPPFMVGLGLEYHLLVAQTHLPASAMGMSPVRMVLYGEVPQAMESAYRRVEPIYTHRMSSLKVVRGCEEKLTNSCQMRERLPFHLFCAPCGWTVFHICVELTV